MKFEDRAYQAKMLADLRDCCKRGRRAPLCVLPTGGGKTVVAKDVIASAVGRNRNVLFLAPRRELIFQTSAKLSAAGVQHGIIMAGEPPSILSGVQVACVPTLYMRAVKNQHMPMPDADVVIVDEAHLVRGEMHEKVLEKYPKAIKIGFTATPARKDGKGLGNIFDELVLGPSVAELIQLGYLVPPRYFVPSQINLEGVSVEKGDYNTKQLAARMDNKTLLGDVLTNWTRLASNRKTVIFTVDVAHSLHIEQTFREAGVKIAHLDANTPKEERAQTLKDLREGRIQVITNCDILTMGWDEPSISCCVLARPTKSLVRYLQAVGRVLRPYEGKSDCIVLDHGGCVDEHGLVDDLHAWSLSATDAISERDRKLREKQERKDLVCGNCTTVFKAAHACPSCGAPVSKSRRLKVDTIDNDLAEYANRQRKPRDWSMEQKRQFYAELMGYVIEKRYNIGAAAHKFRERFGVWPRVGPVDPAVPSAETRAWIRSRNIARAKAREKENNRVASAAV